MMLLQSFAAFGLWIAYGLWMRSQQDRLRIKLQSSSRRHRVLLGSAGFIVSMIVLLGGLAAISALGGTTKEGLKAWAWVAVVVVGSIFIHLQVLGAGAMITLIQDGQPPADPRASDSAEGKPSL